MGARLYSSQVKASALPTYQETEEQPIKVLLAGASGHLGGLICEQLLRDGHAVTALVRHATRPASVSRLKALGAAIAYGDLKQRPSVKVACQGQEAVISTATAVGSSEPGDTIDAVDLHGHLSLIGEAEDGGARHVVYVSFSSNVEPEAPSPLTAAKRAVEQRLLVSPLSHTVLASCIQMEAWLSPRAGFDYASGSVSVYGTGAAPLTWISASDVAIFASKSLTHTAARGARLELGGPEALSPVEVVRIFEEVSGRPFSVTHVPLDGLRATRETSTDPLQKSLASLILQLAAGDVIDMQDTRRCFGVELTSVRAYARRVVSTPKSASPPREQA